MDLAKVVHGRTVTEVGVRDDPDLGKGLERPIHGRQMYFGMLGPNQAGDVLGTEVAIGVEQHPNHEPARRCDSPAVGADLVEDVVDGTWTHRPSVGIAAIGHPTPTPDANPLQLRSESVDPPGRATVQRMQRLQRLQWVRGLVAASALALLAACTTAGGAVTSRPSSDRLVVATTVAPITDIVHQVVGGDATVVGLIPEGVDSHTFEPSPATIRDLAGSNVLFMDGLHLEGSTERQARANLPQRHSIVALGSRTISQREYAFDFSFPESGGDPNPHVWMAPRYAKRFAEIVRDEMVQRDPRHRTGYAARYRRYAEQLDALDRAIAQAVASIPKRDRVLLTYHDAYAYFARDYGMRVLGAVQPNDFSEPSATEVRRLIDQLRATRVPAIFGSEVFPSTVLAQVARETGVRYVDKLRDDELPGRPGSPEHSYVGMMLRNVELMTGALGGDRTILRSVPLSVSAAGPVR